MKERRIFEVVVCALYVLVLSGAAADVPGSSARYEEHFVYIGLSVMLLVFATVLTVLRRDLPFRLLLYPIALLAGAAALLLDIHDAYGYGWNVFWESWPYGEACALIGFAYVLLLDVTVALGTRLLRSRRARPHIRGASGT